MASPQGRPCQDAKQSNTRCNRVPRYWESPSYALVCDVVTRYLCGPVTLMQWWRKEHWSDGGDQSESSWKKGAKSLPLPHHDIVQQWRLRCYRVMRKMYRSMDKWLAKRWCVSLVLDAKSKQDRQRIPDSKSRDTLLVEFDPWSEWKVVPPPGLVSIVDLLNSILYMCRHTTHWRVNRLISRGTCHSKATCVESGCNYH